MGIVYGPISLADWVTMRMIRYDIRECQNINSDGKFDLAIKCNKNCLNTMLKEIWEKAA